MTEISKIKTASAPLTLAGVPDGFLPSLMADLVGFGLVANDYLVVQEPASEVALVIGGPLSPLPVDLTEGFADDGWVSLTLKGPQYEDFEKLGGAAVSDPLAVYRPWNMAFSTFTPARVSWRGHG